MLFIKMYVNTNASFLGKLSSYWMFVYLHFKRIETVKLKKKTL
jgi:hypothetical protein